MSFYSNFFIVINYTHIIYSTGLKTENYNCFVSIRSFLTWQHPDYCIRINYKLKYSKKKYHALNTNQPNKELQNCQIDNNKRNKISTKDFDLCKSLRTNFTKEDGDQKPYIMKNFSSKLWSIHMGKQSFQIEKCKLY